MPTVDLGETSLREFNQALHQLREGTNETDWLVLKPKGHHAVAVGVDAPIRVAIKGSVGYYCGGMNKLATIVVDGSAGPGVAENMMSGVVVIESNAGSLTGAALRGGDLVVKGQVGARSGIDQKGGTIIVLGSAGSMTGFMMQRGRQILCGDVGHGLGDSMYDGTIYVGGKVRSLGIDCVPGEWTEADTEFVERKFRIYGLGDPPELQKFVCGKKLYNYDKLEPAERKLVL